MPDQPNHEPGPVMTRDDVLLWLTDRVGKSVQVEVVVEKGDLDVSVLAAEGELRFWRDEIPQRAWKYSDRVRQNLIGYYAVGAAHVDLSDLEHAEGRMRVDDDVIEVLLAEDVRLVFVDQSDHEEVEPAQS